MKSKAHEQLAAAASLTREAARRFRDLAVSLEKIATATDRAAHGQLDGLRPGEIEVLFADACQQAQMAAHLLMRVPTALPGSKEAAPPDGSSGPAAH